MWSKRRLTLLCAWVVVLGVVAYLATHTRLVAPYASRLVSRNLFRDQGSNLRVKDFRFRYLQGMDLFDVSLTLKGPRGAVTLIAADTLALDYRFGELLTSPVHLRRVSVRGGEIYALRAEPAADSERAVPGWPHLRIDMLEIRDSFMEVSGSDGRLQERIPTLNWRGVVTAGETLNLESRDADIFWETRNSHLSHLFGEITIDDDGVRCRDLHLKLNDSHALLAGGLSWDGDLDLSVQGEDLVTAEIEELLDMDLGFVAAGDLTAAFRSHGDTLRFDAIYTGDLEGYRLEEVSGRAVVTPGSLSWEELTGRINSVFFSGAGSFDLSDPHAVSFFLSGDVTDVDLAQGLVPDEELPATDGHGFLTLFHQQAPLKTRVTGLLHDGAIATIPFDSCRVDVEADSVGVVFHELTLWHRSQRARLTGHTDAKRYFDGQLTLAADDLSQLPETLGWPQVNGRLQVEGAVMGLAEDLSFVGQARLVDFALEPLAFRDGEAAVVVQDLLGSPEVTVDIQGKGLQAGGVPLGEFWLRGKVAAAGAAMESFRAQRGDTLVALQARATFTDTLSLFRIADIHVALEDNHWRLSRPATLAVDSTGFMLPQFQLISDRGALLVRDLEHRGETVAGSLQLQNFALGLLNPFLPPASHLSGEATANVNLSGRASAPELQLTATVSDCSLEPVRIDSLLITAGFRDGRLDIADLDLHSDQGRLTGHGSITNREAEWRCFWPAATLDCELTVTGGDWAFVDRFQIPALDRISGRFDANLQVAGTTDDPEILGSVVSEPFGVHWLHLESLAGRLRLDSQQFVLSELEGRQGALTATGRIEVPLRFDLLSTPVTPEDGPFLMRLTIDEETDLAPLVPATNAFVKAGGRLSLEMTLAGPLSHPYFQGNLTVRNGSFVLNRMEEIYRDVDVDGTWSGDVLTLHRIAGKEGARGTFSGSGTVTFAGLKLNTFAIDLSADRFLVSSIPDLRVLIRSDDMRLEGAKVGPDSTMVPKFSGRLEIIKARYLGDFSEQAGGGGPLAATVAPDWLADIHLIGPPRSARILNRAMEISMSGDVNLIRDLEGLYLRGSLDIDSGRLPVFNNDFRVLQGRLDFSQEVGLVPRVDIEAETTVRVRHATLGGSALERITVHVTGPLPEPVISFYSESGYAREGIERMLLGMSPYAGDPRAAGGLGVASIAAGFNLLEREIATGLNIVDTFDIDQIERQDEDGRTGVVPLIGVGKYLRQDLYVKYAQGLSLADRELLIEYQISRRLLLQSEIRRRIDELQGDTTYSLDLKYRVEY